MQRVGAIKRKRIRHLCRIAAALCGDDEERITSLFRQAVSDNIPVTELREVILTSYLFDGYPTALEGFRLLFETFGYPGGEKLEYNASNVDEWRNRGEKLCRSVYGPQYDRLTRRVEKIAPELRDAMIVEGYGKVLSRSDLDIVTRELCVVSILAAKYRPRQLLSHALGALRLGATPEDLLNIIEDISGITTGENLHRSKEVIEKAISKIS